VDPVESDAQTILTDELDGGKAPTGSVLNVCCQLLFSSFQSPNRTYLHLFLALIGVFGIEKPVRFELKPVRFGILKKLSR
jgi:hypothetical protein